MDDSSVSQVSIQTVMKQQAYLLFYIQSNAASSAPQSPVSKKATELDQSSALQKRKLSEASPLTEKEVSQKITLPVQNSSLATNLDDDDDDPLGDMLFLAKKHHIELPQSVSQNDGDSSLPAEKEGDGSSSKSSRLPPKRYGIFR